MNIKQMQAISYAKHRRALRKREKFILDNEGSLNNFKSSKYKTYFYYILSKYKVRIF